jgi:predicted nucleic acid-binding Zn finger protein
MKKEPLYEVFKKTELDYIKNGNCQFTSKTYKVQYNHKLKRWRCSCAGFVKSGGKSNCKHVRAAAIRLGLYFYSRKLFNGGGP